ncbi:MAG: type II CAAX prenyl endopeptidase Rce1 family protein [Flavobacteriales bacterium]|jgi:membrane protease YdiL (CAAX protease family)
MNSLMKGLSAGPQFILFCALTLTCVGLGTIIAMGVGTAVFAIPLEELPGVLSNPETDHAGALIWMNNITQLIGFGMPVLAYLLLFGNANVHNLMLKKPSMLLIIAPILMLSATPLIDLSTIINKWLIPVGSSLEAAFKPAEELAERMTIMFLDPQSGISAGVVFLSIAIIPAICEELLFRGVLMPLLAKMTRNIHVAIWITAALFSLIHMQFYGFLPRMLMGAVLGYLVIWSGSLWTAILAHFINNATAFLLFQWYGTLETPENSVISSIPFYLIASALFIGLILWNRKHSKWPWMSFEYLGVSEKPLG